MKPKLKDLKDAEDFNDYAEAMFSDFCQSLIRDGFTRPITEDDGVDPKEFSFAYTDRGANLIDRYINRMARVGNRHFPNGDVEVRSYYYRELE